MKISDNFTYEELTNTSLKDYLQDVRNAAQGYSPALYALANYVLEPIRTVLGNTPLTVTSGMRSKSLNNKLGGVANSQHLYGQAVDLIPQKMDVKEAFLKLKEYIEKNPKHNILFGQLILESNKKIVDGKVVTTTWIHVSLGSPFTKYNREIKEINL